RGRAREAVKDYSRRGRILGRAKTRGCRSSAGHRASQRATALSADSDRDRRGEKYDGHLSGSGGLFLGTAKAVRKRRHGAGEDCIGKQSCAEDWREWNYGFITGYRNNLGNRQAAGPVLWSGWDLRVVL